VDDSSQLTYNDSPSLGWLAAGVAIGTAGALLIIPHWLPGMISSVTGDEAKGFWYISRIAGWEAYFFLWASLVLGLAITGRVGRAWWNPSLLFALHELTGLLGTVLALTHALILIGDRFIGYNPVQILVPFSQPAYRPFWVGLGQLALYLLLPTTLTFYLRRKLGYQMWRRLHYGTFAVYYLGAMHALGAGSDSLAAASLWFYGITSAVAYGLVLIRLWDQSRPTRRALRPNAKET